MMGTEIESSWENARLVERLYDLENPETGELPTLRQQLEENQERYLRKLVEAYRELAAIGAALDDPRTDLSMTMVEVIEDMKKQLASVTKERDEWRQGARNLQCEHQKVSEELDELMEICVGLATGTDWNKGTHAEIYRPKLLAKVGGGEWKGEMK